MDDKVAGWLQEITVVERKVSATVDINFSKSGMDDQVRADNQNIIILAAYAMN